MKLFYLLLLISFSAFSQTDKSDMDKANNPLTPMLGVNLQDYLTPSIYGTDKTSNSFLLRSTLPHKIGRTSQIMRLTVPYLSVPVPSDENVQGLGDVNIFDLFLLKPYKGIQFGVGPLFVFPTATKAETGADKWQAGLAGVMIKPTDWGLTGALLTHQKDFSGPSERADQSLLTFQPFLNINFPKGFYIRSTAVWNFNWVNGDYYIPIGAGVGKVWKLESGKIINLFAEPQWTVAHEGEGQPVFQAFMGINMQFPLGE